MCVQVGYTSNCKTRRARSRSNWRTEEKKKKIGEKGIYLRQVERRGLPFFGYEAKGDMKRKAVASGRRGQGQKLTRQDDGTK